MSKEVMPEPGLMKQHVGLSKEICREKKQTTGAFSVGTCPGDSSEKKILVIWHKQWNSLMVMGIPD